VKSALNKCIEDLLKALFTFANFWKSSCISSRGSLCNLEKLQF